MRQLGEVKRQFFFKKNQLWIRNWFIEKVLFGPCQNNILVMLPFKSPVSPALGDKTFLTFFGNMTSTHNYAIIFLTKMPYQKGIDKNFLSRYIIFYGEKNPTSKPTTIPSLSWRLDLLKGQRETNKKLPHPIAGEDKN